MTAFILQAVGLFIVTNIDDIIVLALFFARGAVELCPTYGAIDEGLRTVTALGTTTQSTGGLA